MNEVNVKLWYLNCGHLLDLHSGATHLTHTVMYETENQVE